jgi:lipopolysaccharide/colanic/teichoic acid biosynthesis glycosyltransferase
MPVRHSMLKILRPRTNSKVNGNALSSRNGSTNHGLVARDSFMRTIYLEQKRTERSRRRFVLMLLESPSLLEGGAEFEKVVSALWASTRETDLKGWYREGSVIGIVFTEIAPAEGRTVANSLLTKINTALDRVLNAEQRSRLKLTCHVFPEDWHDHDSDDSHDSKDTSFDPHLLRDSDPKRLALLVKAAMDVVGSLVALILVSPLLLLIAAAVKLTSKGPILFRQQRVGQYGRKFTFLKFRSMYTANNHKIHQEFVKELIAGNGKSGNQPGGAQTSVYKITNDPRITTVGRFLRKTSLDELPQFLNVLRGDMSLVGPRPPIPYEVECYDIWHKRRLLAVKPGITGLWQVRGRSKTSFDEMVRLDLKYGQTWSLWLDIKILLETPRAVFTGDGAY